MHHESLTRLMAQFEELKNAKGNRKKEIVRSYQTDDSFLSALTMLLNPYVTFGMSGKKLTRYVEQKPKRTFSNLTDLLRFLDSQRGISDQTIADVRGFIGTCGDVENQTFVRGMISKSIRLGLTARTVNEALGRQQIPVFDCMLAERYANYPHFLDGHEFAVTEKLDGIRCVAVAYNNHVSLFSRQGQLMEGLEDIEEELFRVLDGFAGGFVLDGELLVADREHLPSAMQYKETTRIVRSDGRKTGITYHVFDCLTPEEFFSHSCATPYCKRRENLEKMPFQSPWMEVVPVLYRGKDQSAVMRCLSEERAKEHEGVMVNLLYAGYEFRRTKNLLKVKLMQDVDLRIIGFQEGDGKYAGTLGALVVDYKGTAVCVGSGLSDAERQWFWENRPATLGRIVTVQCFEETTDAHGKPSLRFPVFKELREEGKEVSYS